MTNKELLQVFAIPVDRDPTPDAPHSAQILAVSIAWILGFIIGGVVGAGVTYLVMKL